MTSDKLMFLITGMAGSMLVNLSAQFVSVNIVDIQGGVFSTPDEASWIQTGYTMASFAGIACSVQFIKALGVGRYLVWGALGYAAAALACALAPELRVMIALRVLQGFVAGGFGPAAFAVVFMAAGGPRLPFAMTMFAFVLLFPGTIGPVVSGFLENGFGWQSLFLVQAGVGLVLALAARIWAPRQDFAASALKTDWTAIALLSLAAAALGLVFGQGTRRFWLESNMIVWAAAVGLGAFAGFVFTARFSPMPIILLRLLLTRRFGIPVGLYTAFRAGLVAVSYLVPQFLAVVQGYRPLDIARLMQTATFAQVLAVPLAWWLMHRLDMRAIMAFGLALCTAGTVLVIDGTALYAADQFRLMLVFFAVGQVLFVAPTLVAVTAALQPPEFPTASLTFNMGTLCGVTLGTGLASNFVTEREKFHSSVLTESVSLYRGLDADRVALLANRFADRLTDDAGATAQAVARLAAAARREAWVISFNDAFFIVALVLLVSVIVPAAIRRSPPLPRREPPLSGEQA